MVIRAFIYVKSEGFSLSSNRYCDLIVDEIRSKETHVLWVRCGSKEDFLKLIHELLVLGFFPQAIASLSGNVKIVEELDFNKIWDFLSEVKTLNHELIIEYVKPNPPPITDLVKEFEIEEIKFSLKNPKRIYVKAKKQIDITKLFDLGFKIIKPIKIPP